MKRLFEFHHLLKGSGRSEGGTTKEIAIFLHKAVVKALRNGYSTTEIASVLQISVISIKKIQLIYSLSKHLSKIKINFGQSRGFRKKLSK